MKISSLYIHIPFCSRKCLFCSFTIAVGQEHRREDYVRAVVQEMQKYQGRTLKTIYLGGGTPSLLDGTHIDFLMSNIRRNFLLQDNIEITLEANPETMDRAKIALLKKYGINRVSLGLQSMDDRYLKFLGRSHSAAKAVDAFQLLRAEGFNNINLDLMYGFPGQTPQELENDVKAIAGFNSEHLSLYTLTIEPQSRFHAAQLKLDDDEKLAQQYLLVNRLLKEHGFHQYEVSNFAKSGHQSAHNTNYWLGDPYIGLGVGAHGFDGRRRYWNTARLQDYLQRAGEDPTEGHEDLNDDQLIIEKVLFGLRMNKGIAWDIVPADKRAQVEDWITDGFFLREGATLKVTDQGRLVLDALSSRLI